MKNLISNVNVSCKLTAHKGGNVNSRLSPCGLYGHSGGRGGEASTTGGLKESPNPYIHRPFFYTGPPPKSSNYEKVNLG